MSQSKEDIVFTEESFAEKDSSGFYILHVTEDVKQKILGWQKYSQFLESIKGEYTLIMNPKLEIQKQIKSDRVKIMSEDPGTVKGFTLRLKLNKQDLVKIATEMLGTPITDDNKKVIGTITDVKVDDTSQGTIKVIGKFNHG